jgi:enoyl-[acyl-carrier-protein] reductase (NADH)
MGSHSREVFRPVAERAGLTVEEMLRGSAAATLLKRLPTLAEAASTAAFMASDRAGAMTGTNREPDVRVHPGLIHGLIRGSHRGTRRQ